MILVVDDYLDSAAALKRLLEVSGYSAQFASSGEEAMAAMHRDTPELVIMDDMMPGTSGMDVFAQMKQDRQLSDVPVLFYSAGNDQRRMDQAARNGVGWIVKGRQGVHDLLSAVRRAAGPQVQ